MPLRSSWWLMSTRSLPPYIGAPGARPYTLFRVISHAVLVRQMAVCGPHEYPHLAVSATPLGQVVSCPSCICAMDSTDLVERKHALRSILEVCLMFNQEILDAEGLLEY
mmetsp:Transcript_4700/g.10374  ORF Transcript_4700/g.10374 Transcript_4700/m.10374 type:complete len:109 (+) Transcript_4700:1838-2164(+)